LQPREIYSPRGKNTPTDEEEELSTPKVRRPLLSKRYVLQETPYLANLRLALDSALQRPVSYHNKLKNLLMNTTSEKFFIPLFLVNLLCRDKNVGVGFLQKNMTLLGFSNNSLL
jgi:hypothetical protein